MWIVAFTILTELLKKFCKLYLDRDDVLDVLREVIMSPKMKKKGRPRGAKNHSYRLAASKKSKEVLSVSPNPSQSLAHWKRMGSYWNMLHKQG